MSIKLPHTTKLDIAYLAGIFDGEGCITTNHKSSEKEVYIIANIYNTDMKLITWIASRVIGFSVYSRRAKTENSKTCYTLAWHKSNTYEFLELVLPYLVIKKDRALVALQMKDQVSREVKLKVHSEIRRLNAFGVRHVQ